MIRNTPRGVPTPRHDGGAPPARPHVRPTATLAQVEEKILAALETGPKTLGELGAYHCRNIVAAVRDQAVEVLIRDRRVRLTELPRREPNRAPMPALALALAPAKEAEGGHAC